MDATGAILFFGFVATLLLLGIGVGAYLGLLPEWWAYLKTFASESWDSFKTSWAARQQRLAQEQQLGIVTAFAPNAILDGVVEKMTRERWAVQHRSETTATFARDEGADAGVGCCLMLFFIIPGLLYLMLANRTVRVTVAAYPYEEARGW